MTSQEALDLFNKIYEDTYAEITKYVVLNVTNINDVADIVQNIYVGVYKSILKNKDINKAYIWGIVKKKIKDYYRFSYKYHLNTIYKENMDLIEDKDIKLDMSLKYDITLVWKYLRKKKVIIAKIFYLYYMEEMKIKDIAVLLNLTESNVKHYIYRTLKELNKYIER